MKYVTCSMEDYVRSLKRSGEEVIGLALPHSWMTNVSVADKKKWGNFKRRYKILCMCKNYKTYQESNH